MTLSNSPLHSRPVTRRNLLLTAGAFSMLAATGCTPQPSGSGSGSGSGSLRFAWWGGVPRQEAYTDFAGVFADANPDVSMELEPAEYDAYLDRLAVQASAGNVADTFWVPGSQYLTYASQSVMLDLDELGEGTIDYSDFNEGQVDSWRVLDGKLYSAVYSQYNPIIQINKGEMDSFGIDLPDDETWDWADFHSIGREYSEAKGEGFYGIAYTPDAQLHVMHWIRQQGAELFDAEGNVGFDAAVFGDWFAMWEEWVADGSAMPPQVSAGTAYPQVANNIAMTFAQPNHYADNTSVTEGELTMHLMPAIPDAAPGYPFMWYNRICVAANTPDPELAGRFINFFINDPASLETAGVISGPPSNPELRRLAVEMATDDNDEAALKILKIVERGSEQEMRPRPEIPAGASGWTTLFSRTAENIALGGVPITEAIENFMVELQRGIDAAR